MTPREAIDVVLELRSEAAEYAGPEDEDLSSNAGIWHVIDAAEEACEVLTRAVAALDTIRDILYATNGARGSEWTVETIEYVAEALNRHDGVTR